MIGRAVRAWIRALRARVARRHLGATPVTFCWVRFPRRPSLRTSVTTIHRPGMRELVRERLATLEIRTMVEKERRTVREKTRPAPFRPADDRRTHPTALPPAVRALLAGVHAPALSVRTATTILASPWTKRRPTPPSRAVVAPVVRLPAARSTLYDVQGRLPTVPDPAVRPVRRSVLRGSPELRRVTRHARTPVGRAVARPGLTATPFSPTAVSYSADNSWRAISTRSLNLAQCTIRPMPRYRTAIASIPRCGSSAVLRVARRAPRAMRSPRAVAAPELVLRKTVTPARGGDVTVPAVRATLVTEVVEHVVRRVDSLVTERVSQRLRRAPRADRELVAQVSRSLGEEIRFERERLGP